MAYSPTEALSYGWRKFSASPSTLLVPMIVAWVGIVITVVIVDFVIIPPLFNSSSFCSARAWRSA